MTYVISVEPDAVVISGGGGKRTKVATYDEVVDYLVAETIRLRCEPGDLRIFHSSTVDFPEEVTSDPEVLALAERLSTKEIAFPRR